MKTKVLVAFLVIWNAGFIIAMVGFGNGFTSPITPAGGIVISMTCMLACIFSLLVARSEKFRIRLLDPKRAHNYRAKDFYLLSFIAFTLSIGVILFPKV